MKSPLSIAGGSAGVSAGRAAQLRAALGPRSSEPGGGGRVRLLETTVLVLVGIALATATVYDLRREVHTNERLVADLRTWRAFTGHDYRDLTLSSELLGARSHHDLVCGNTSAGAPDARSQLCLVVWGPERHGRRTVHGGWYLPPKVQDLPYQRYGCFGELPPGICPH
jgi:hypothetical protein